MIAIVSSSPRERSALSGLCEQSSWPCLPCDSLRALKKLIHHAAPIVVVARSKLVDAYSDEVLALIQASPASGIRTIILCPADLSSARVARQIFLGADCVLRDPVHPEVLMAYLKQYLAPRTPMAPRRSGPKHFHLAGGLVDPIARTVHREGKCATLTPREIELAEVLSEADGELLPYQTLYHEVLGRSFRGDTSNMRVLLGKLCASLRRVGIDLRRHVSVISKSGYCYRAEPSPAANRRGGNLPRQPSAA